MATISWCRPAIIACLLMLSAPAVGAPVAPSQELFEARYLSLRVAMDSHSPAAVRAFFAPDFLSEDVKGQQTGLDAMLKGIAQISKVIRRNRKTSIIAVKIDHNEAYVTQQYDADVERPVIGGVPRQLHFKTISNDVWIRSGGEWLISRSTTRVVDVIEAGQTVVHQQHP